MDINFHYFAVKTLALYAGFSDEDAQRIATFSEFVDDFNWITYITCRNIPEYITGDPDCDLVRKTLLSSRGNFNPAMTGFAGPIDYSFLAVPRTQRLTVSPFHFIPDSLFTIAEHTRTKPAAVGDGSIISDLLVDARTAMQEKSEPWKLSLMRIGMYLHTFADTHAHQRFSGYRSWVNDVKVTRVIANEEENDITGAVTPPADETSTHQAGMLTPAIGHACAGHAPDLTYVTFTMNCKETEDDSAYRQSYTRNNTDAFLVAARQIVNYLRSCRRAGDLSEDEWAALSARLRRVFLMPYGEDTDIWTHITHWRKVFPEYCYAFGKENVQKSFYSIPSGADASNMNYTDDFYRFNHIADKVLIKMYGPRPRGV